jgi:acetate kinase
MVNHESGLLGVSETSSDMRDLEERESRDVRAAEAIALFCYQAKKWIGSFAAALGGLDTLVFAGGIGENSPVIRRRICADLGFLGIQIHPKRNARNAPLISSDAGRVRVRVIHTDEELMIARSVTRILRLGANNKQEATGRPRVAGGTLGAPRGGQGTARPTLDPEGGSPVPPTQRNAKHGKSGPRRVTNRKPRR